MDLGSGKFNLWLKAGILISCKLQAPSNRLDSDKDTIGYK